MLARARHADRHRHRLLLPDAWRHYGACPRTGARARPARPRGDGRDGSPAAHAHDRRRGRQAARRRGLRRRSPRPRRAALRQCVTDDPHRAGRARPAAAEALQAARGRRRAPARALQPEHVRDRAARDPRRTRSASRPTTRSSRPASCSTSSRRSCGAGSASLDAHVVVVRGVHRLARAVLPLRLPDHPERHRRPALLAGRRAAARAARGRQAADPVPRAVRSAQRPADDARGVPAGACRARGIGAAVRRRRRAARQRLPAQAPGARGRRRDLGRPRRLVAPALLRVGRHPLHALPARLVRDGAARGDGDRAPGRGQPHLGLPAAHGARQARADGERGR